MPRLDQKEGWHDKQCCRLGHVTCTVGHDEQGCNVEDAGPWFNLNGNLALTKATPSHPDKARLPICHMLLGFRTSVDAVL